MNDDTRRAWIGFGELVAILLVCLFVPAWSLRYWHAWAYIAVFVASAAAITAYLVKHDPELLRRRVRAGAAAETRPVEKIIQSIASVAFAAILIVPAFDHRLEWSAVPVPLVIAGDALVVGGFWLVFLTFRENSFASATIETAEDQRVIASGPYAFVRHPMYAGALVMLVGTPLALGSYWALLGVLVMLAALVWRLLDEERLLSRELRGYAAYTGRVKRRLVPFVW